MSCRTRFFHGKIPSTSICLIGCIIFGSDQEVAGVMRAVRRRNATGVFSWIGSDGWSARGLVSNGNEPEVEGTLSVQPQANPVKGFEEYFLNLTVENNRRNPWFVGKRSQRMLDLQQETSANSSLRDHNVYARICIYARTLAVLLLRSLLVNVHRQTFICSNSRSSSSVRRRLTFLLTRSLPLAAG